MSGPPQCNWGHTDIKLCVTFLAPSVGPVVIECYIFGTQCGACITVCVTFWCPMWGLKVLGGMGKKEALLSGLKSTTSVKEMFNHISL